MQPLWPSENFMSALARAIDHTLLKPEATAGDIQQLVAQAIQHRFASVCVNGRWVDRVARFLHEAGADNGPDPIKTCAVVGFPLGACKTSLKAMEAVAAVKDGAQEIDMVIALDALFSGDLPAARDDVFEVVRAARAVWRSTVVKVILETLALTEPQIALGCQAAVEAGADFVKTSTGFHPQGGATEQAVRLLRKYAPGLSVKASGGIRDRATAEKYLALGATRIGTSNGVAMVT
jgi:deoxyribose-phosphate aldolase